MDTALQIQPYKDEIEKDQSPGGWHLLLQGHTADSACSALGLPRLFLHSCFPASWPRACIFAWAYDKLEAFALAHFSVLLQSLGIAALPNNMSRHIPV